MYNDTEKKFAHATKNRNHFFSNAKMRGSVDIYKFFNTLIKRSESLPFPPHDPYCAKIQKADARKKIVIRFVTVHTVRNITTFLLFKTH